MTDLNIARALRNVGMFTKPPRGQGHLKAKVTYAYLTNFFFGQAAAQASDAPEVATRLRAMVFRGPNKPTLGPGNFGQVFDRLLIGVAPDSELAADFAKQTMPNEIHITVNPYRADLVWMEHGKLPRGETYADPTSTAAFRPFLILKRMHISPALIDFAREMLADPNPKTKGAIPHGRRPLVDVPAANRADVRPTTPKTGLTPRGSMDSTPKTATVTTEYDCACRD